MTLRLTDDEWARVHAWARANAGDGPCDNLNQLVNQLVKAVVLDAIA